MLSQIQHPPEGMTFGSGNVLLVITSACQRAQAVTTKVHMHSSLPLWLALPGMVFVPKMLFLAVLDFGFNDPRSDD